MKSAQFGFYFSRLGKSLSSRGVIRTGGIVLEHFFFSRSREFIMYRSMKKEGACNPAFVYRMARPEELDLLGVFDDIYDRKTFQTLFDEGDFLFIALEGTKPIAFQWLSRRSRTRPPYSFFRLQNTQVWVVDAYTLPAFRRLGVAASLRSYRDRFLMNLGFTEVLAPISEDDHPSLKFFMRAGPHSVHYFSFTRILWFTIFRRELNAKKRLLHLVESVSHTPQHA